MKLTYRDPGYEYSARSIAEFIKQDESRTTSIFHFLPELGKFKGVFSRDTDNRDILVCNITLNPISPRYLQQWAFDVFYLNSDKGSLGSALHEITHYLWFHLWNKKHNDSYEQYESPGLIWILSEAVVEQILKHDDFNKINPYHKGENAYSCFYKMMIGEKQLYDHLDAMYKNNSIDKFMEESYQFIIENEEKIRSQMPNRGSY